MSENIESASTGAKINRLLLWGTIAAGVTAAFLMHRRGESVATIAKKAFTDPLGSFVSEIRNIM